MSKTITATAKQITTLTKGLSDFNRERLVGAICWSTKNQMKFGRDKINEVVSQLRDLRDNYNGSEAQTAFMERKLDFVQQLEDQHDEMEHMHIAAQQVMKEEFGHEWKQPAKQGTLDKTQTEASRAATALLEKYGK